MCSLSVAEEKENSQAVICTEAPGLARPESATLPGIPYAL